MEIETLANYLNNIPFVVEANNLQRSHVEAYRKQEKAQLEAKARAKSEVTAEHSQVNSDAIADQLAKLINPSPKPKIKAFFEV